jgi:serine/threonine-protein kinase RsbW
VSDDRGTPELERPVARVTVTTDAELLSAVVAFVRQVARRLGSGDKAAEQLDRAVETVCRNVIEHAFDLDEDGHYDVEILRRPGRIVIAVEDRGLPFDYAPRRCSTTLSPTRCAS